MRWVDSKFANKRPSLKVAFEVSRSRSGILPARAYAASFFHTVLSKRYDQTLHLTGPEEEGMYAK